MPSKPVPVGPAFSRSPDTKFSPVQKYASPIGADVVPVEAYPLLPGEPYSIEDVDRRLQERAGPGK